MSHHSESSLFKPDPEHQRAMLGLREEMENMRLGATGEYPDGKIGENDEGELRFAIAADPATGKVFIDFGKSIRSLGLTAKQASDFADMLVAKSLVARGIV
jgi:hypothetical protein